jgi:hypothetical protein
VKGQAGMLQYFDPGKSQQETYPGFTDDKEVILLSEIKTTGVVRR